MGITLQSGELQAQGYRAVTVVPPPERAGRYRIEFGDARRVSALPSYRTCGCKVPESVALVWLSFVEQGREEARELSDAVCSRCEPDRFGRVQDWARQLGQAENVA